MATIARDAMGKTKIEAIADRGYFSGPEIKACTEAGITPLVPKPMTSNARAEGRFSKLDFVYIAKEDEYQCPAGERAIFRFATVENGMTIRKYWSSACPGCPPKTQCTTSSYRRIARWEHERILEAMQRRLDRMPEAMTLRRRTVEHVFGTPKYWMGRALGPFLRLATRLSYAKSEQQARTTRLTALQRLLPSAFPHNLGQKHR